MRFAVACLIFSVATFLHAQKAQLGPKPRAAPSDIRRLQAVVLPDLQGALTRAYGGSFSSVELSREYRHCRFDYLRLGRLGTGVRVSWDGAPAPNSAFTGLYLKRGHRFRRVYTGVGFGPEVIAGSKIPDLVVGSTNGVCTETLTRLHFDKAAYRPDACIRHIQGSDGNCKAVSCSDGLPAFPDPYPPE